jgi:excisionase family DNA binding protein
MAGKESVKEVLTTFEAAKYCSTSYMSVKRWIWSGDLNAFKTPGGHFRVVKSDLVDFMRKHQIPIPEEVPAVRRKILIIDRDGQICGRTAHYLRLNCMNIELETACDSFEAGIMVSLFKPDIVIIDLADSGTDGHSICERLKKSPLSRNMKIIALTALTGDEDIQKALGCGADRVLSKPVEMEELNRIVREYME